MWCRSQWPPPRRRRPAGGLGSLASASPRSRVSEQPAGKCSPLLAVVQSRPGPAPPAHLPARAALPSLAPGEAWAYQLLRKSEVSQVWAPAAAFPLPILHPGPPWSTPILHHLPCLHQSRHNWKQFCSSGQFYSFTCTCAYFTLLLFL